MLSELLLTELSTTPHSKLPLHRQLYEALRRAILDGRLNADERLPSSRSLVQDLKLSRNTVVAALNQLAVEGYLVSRVGSGTFVNSQVPQRPRHRRPAQTHQNSPLSHRGQSLSTQFCASELEVQPFTPGIADFSAFPVALWQRLQNKHWRMTYPDMLDYSGAGGHAPLRRALADYLRVFRSVPLDDDQVIITSGTQESLVLCAQLLANHERHGLDRRSGLLGRGQGIYGHRSQYACDTCGRTRHRTTAAGQSAHTQTDLRHAVASVSNGRSHVVGATSAAPGVCPPTSGMDS